MRPNDEDLDAAVRGLAPRLPEGFTDRTMNRVERSARARRLRRMIGGGMAVLAAAAAVVLMVRGQSSPEVAATPAGWRVIEVVGAPELTAGATLAAGTAMQMSSGGHARLRDQEEHDISLRANTNARTETGALSIGDGSAQLLRDGTIVKTVVATVTTIGADADVELAVRTFDPTRGALLTVNVRAGGAKIEAGNPVRTAQLRAGDRLLMGQGGPPLTMHTAASKAALAAAPNRPATAPERPAALAKPTRPGSAPPPPVAAVQGASLDKEVIRTGMQSALPKIKECYERALQRDPHLGGKLVVTFTIAAQDGHGKVVAGEIAPDEEQMDAPLAAQCVLNTITEIEFPPPQGDGVVQVSYPFVFATTDE